jgi:hypothetical protein
MSALALPTPGPAGRPACLASLQLRRAEPVLSTAALLALLALVPVLLALAIDVRTVNGINVWIKPAKFLLSFVVYYATLAWVFTLLPRAVQASRAGRFVIWAPVVIGLLEMLWLILAAAQGVPSHFNADGVGWRLAYLAAGGGAVVLLVAVLAQGVLVARHAHDLAPVLRDALVLGAVIAFGATLVTAGYLSSGSGHWVGGVASDAAGLPLLGWSRTGGDLRVAHFWALHAQQAIPLLGLALVRLGWPRARAALWLGAAAYLAFVAFTFVQAVRGMPFLPLLS